MATTKQRVVIGAEGGRGPCSRCGLVADLHVVEERFEFAPAFATSRDLCLPCALGAEAVAPLPHLVRKAA